VANVGELGQLVEHGWNGFLIDGSEPESFASAVEPLLADDGLRRRFAAAGRESASAFTTPETTKRWDRILAEL
jgi:glycosyltransferase involved in cell wall biosynthesis